MPNCSVSIPSWETSGKLLSSSPTNVSFTMVKNDTLFFELSNTQTVYIYVNVGVTGTNNPSYMLNIYDATTYSLVSSLTTTTLNLSTNIDLLSGTYIVCLRSLAGSFSGTAKADYYGFGRVVTFQPNVSETMSSVNFDLKTDPRRKPCEKDMKWEIVEGKLPPGLTLNTNTGMLFGRIPYLDCLDEPDSIYNNVPSSNQFFTAGIGKYETIEPWGRRWNWKMRISIVDQPEHYDEKWFCLLVYNDWTRTAQKFINEYENKLEYGEIIKNVDKRYQVGLCETICDKKDNNKELFDNVIKEFLQQGIDFDDANILHIEINPTQTNTINSNTTTIYEFSNNTVTTKEHIIEDDGINYFGAYGNHHTTIEMDEDILNQRNVYVPEVQVGYISEDLMIEVDSYDQYLGFRQYARYATTDPNSSVFQYKDVKIFKDFMEMKDNVKYEYMQYDPKKGIEGVDDSTGFSDKINHFIYIYYDNLVMPEIKHIEKMRSEGTKDAPWDLMMWQGESVTFSLSRSKYNEVI